MEKQMETTETAVATTSQNQIYKNYFVDGKPIPFGTLTKRIKKQFNAIENTSCQAMLDLFFLHQNFKTFYNRKDNFKKFVNEELSISRSMAYGIINSMNLLIGYYKKKTPEMETFMQDITNSVNSVGIRKLIIMSSIPDENKKFGLIDKLLEGDEITVEELQIKAKAAPKAASRVSIVDNKLLIDNVISITFANEVEAELRKVVEREVNKYLNKKH
jgi:hypothetical protein